MAEVVKDWLCRLIGTGVILYVAALTGGGA